MTDVKAGKIPRDLDTYILRYKHSCEAKGLKPLPLYADKAHWKVLMDLFDGKYLDESENPRQPNRKVKLFGVTIYNEDAE